MASTDEHAGRALPSYRIYRLETQSGRRGPGEWVEAADDDSALNLARTLVPDTRCEVWLETRLVAILRPEPGSFPASLQY